MVGLSKRNSCIESFAAGCSHQSWSWPRGVLCRKRIDQKRWKEVRRITIVTLEMKKHRSNMGEGGIIWSFCREKFIWSQQRILLDVCPWVETEGVSKRRMRRKKLMREGGKGFVLIRAIIIRSSFDEQCSLSNADWASYNFIVIIIFWK